jgi:hypothetical protein
MGITAAQDSRFNMHCRRTVAMDEHLARGQATDLIGRHAAVRAANPEVCRSDTTKIDVHDSRCCTTPHSRFGLCCSARFLKNVGSAAFMPSTHVLLFSSRFWMSRSPACVGPQRRQHGCCERAGMRALPRTLAELENEHLPHMQNPEEL